MQVKDIRKLCDNFVNALIDGGVIERTDIFIMLDDSAGSAGYKIAARQQGIRGTFIQFEKG